MKIYSSIITLDDVQAAAASIPAVYVRPGAHIIDKRTRRIEGLTIGARTAERPKNWRELDPSAMSGGPMGGRRSMPQNATYNEHGRFMAFLFDIDPDAVMVSAVHRFGDREDFHAQTGGTYATATPVESA